MTLGEFKRLLDIYGGDFLRWDAALRGEATLLLQRSEEARRWLQEAVEFDRALAAADKAEQRHIHAGQGAEVAIARIRAGMDARLSTYAAPQSRFIVRLMRKVRGWPWPSDVLPATCALAAILGLMIGWEAYPAARPIEASDILQVILIDGVSTAAGNVRN